MTIYINMNDGDSDAMDNEIRVSRYPELLAFRGQWHKPQSFGFANFKDR